MHHRATSPLAVLLSTLAALAALAAVGCSSAPEGLDQGNGNVTRSDPTKPADDGNKGGTGTNKPTTPTTPTTPTKPTTPAADECSKKADADACFDCCIAKDVPAFEVGEKAYDDCICAPAACQTRCAASVCGQTKTEPTADCNACLETNGPGCSAKAKTACEASTGCKAVEACYVAQCKPLEKP